MLNKLLFILAFSLALTSYAQEEIITFKNSLKSSESDIKDVIPIVNQKTDAVSLFFIASKKIYGYLLDSDFKITQQRVFENMGKKYEVLLGNGISKNNDYRMYLSNDNYSKFISVNFSYQTDSTTLKELELELKKERVLETVNFNNSFYLLTLSHKEPIINIYAFDDDANFKKHQINFTGDRFINTKGKETTINKLLEEIVKIEENNVNAIDLTSVLSKLVVAENRLIFSFDQNKDTTQLVAIDMDTYEKQIRKLYKPFTDSTAKQKKSNSYVNHEHLFSLSASKDQFTFAVRDLKTGVVVNKYAFTVDDSITFKNSSIIQIGAVYDNYRELEKTKKFLQKITYGNVGISVHKTGDEYQIFFGGQHEYRATTGGMGMIRPGKGVQLTGGTLQVQHANLSLLGFNLYSDTKSTYIKALVNDNFVHVKGDIKRNAFDKVKDFEENRENGKNIKTLFKYKDYYILGNYLEETNQYRLRKFKN